MERGLKKDVRRRDADEDVCLSRRERDRPALARRALARDTWGRRIVIRRTRIRTRSRYCRMVCGGLYHRAEKCGPITSGIM